MQNVHYLETPMVSMIPGEARCIPLPILYVMIG